MQVLTTGKHVTFTHLKSQHFPLDVKCMFLQNNGFVKFPLVKRLAACYTNKRCCGCSLVVKLQLPKLASRVRFSSTAAELTRASRQFFNLSGRS